MEATANKRQRGKTYSGQIVIALLLTIRSAQLASAGTQGAYINSSGVGVAVDNVSYLGNTSTGSSGSVPILNPSAGVPGATRLPKECPSSVYCDSQGFANYLWNIQCFVTGGASADAPSIDAQGVRIIPQNCANYTIQSVGSGGSGANGQIIATDQSGLITVNTSASAGAAVWLRGFEYTPQPGDPPGFVPSLADLLDPTKSSVVWNLLLVGPFDHGVSEGSCPLTIPFTLQTTAQNLYFVADGVAKSTAPTLTCPSEVNPLDCDNNAYPQLTITGTCDNNPNDFGLVFNPPLTSIPYSTTPVPVTAYAYDKTATDSDPNNPAFIAQCTFNIDTSKRLFSIAPTTAKLVFSCLDPIPLQYPANIVKVTGGCDVHVTFSPNANDIVPGSGPTTVTATATDKYGRQATCTFLADVSQSPKFATFSVTAPDVTFKCSDSLVYPAPTINGACGAVTLKYSPLATALPPGASQVPVTLTATDSANPPRTATTTFKASRSAFSFQGFEDPINGIGGSCSAPIRTITAGSKLPIKFELECGDQNVTTGTPHLSIKSCTSGAEVGNGNFQFTPNDWHFNWITDGLPVGTYEVDVTLPDGSVKYVFIALTKQKKNS